MRQALLNALAALVVASVLSACGARASVIYASSQAASQDEIAVASTAEAGLMGYLMLLMFASSEAVDSADVNAMSPLGDDNVEL